MSGTLFVVATPIGNLEDITLRALRVLREANVIAAEDTRRTAKLLAHYAISTPTLSFHEHNTRSRIPQLLARLERGDRVALVTDAGTPGISDPGIDLVRASNANGIAVDPVPGPSAPVAAAVASGFALDSLMIFGFVPAAAKARTAWIIDAAAIAGTFTFFETPHRILRTLQEASRYWGDRPIFVGREITKVHQQFLHGTAGAIIGLMPNPRGEFTIVVAPKQPTRDAEIRCSDQDIFMEFGRETKSMAGRRAIISSLARRHGRSVKDIYNLIERLKNSGA
jgi:16S rRNA (cytidine1402-2'-O)-methyltransferase